MNRHELELKAKEYRSIPFWSWNDKLDIEQLKKCALEVPHEA